MKALRALFRFYTHFGAGFVVGGIYVGMLMMLWIAAPAAAHALMRVVMR
jgi:hypothetical protein